MAITVLQIEDDKRGVDIFKEYLETHQIYVEACVDNLNDTLKELNKRDFDFIIVDMNLFGNNRGGIEIIQAISLLTNAYIIVLSGSGLLDEIVYEAFEYGAVGYELKVNIDDIVNAIKNIQIDNYPMMSFAREVRRQRLKDKQKDILEDLKNNMTIKELSKKNSMSYEAIKQQKKHIKQKLGVYWRHFFVPYAKYEKCCKFIIKITL